MVSMKTNDAHANHCPYYHQAIELIGRRWSGAILRVIYSGETRFSEIAHSVPGLSDRLLSERLKELEQEGIVVRNVYPETPVRIEYCLTEKGRDLGRVMDAIGDWAHKWLAPKLEAEPLEVTVESGARTLARSGY
jgi:DNA-binding HxlR family transcriptional regulator